MRSVVAGIPVPLVQVSPPSVEYWATPWLEPATALPLLLGYHSTSKVRSIVRWLQVAPASAERRMPDAVAASMSWFEPGWNERRVTKYQLASAGAASCVQFWPPSVLLKIPAPRTFDELEVPSGASKKPSPVPA